MTIYKTLRIVLCCIWLTTTPTSFASTQIDNRDVERQAGERSLSDALEHAIKIYRARDYLLAESLLRPLADNRDLSETERANARYYLARTFSKQKPSKSDDALEMYEKAADDYRRLGAQNSLLLTLRHLGTLRLVLEDNLQALLTLEEAKAILQRSPEISVKTTTVGAIEYRLMTAYYRNGDLDNAQKAFRQAYMHLQDSPRNLAHLFCDVVPLLLAVKRDDALVYAREALRLYREQDGDSKDLAQAEMRIAQVLLRNSETRNLAMEHAKNSYSYLLKSREAGKTRMRLLFTLAGIHSFEEDPFIALSDERAKDSTQLYREAMSLAEQLKDTRHVAFILVGSSRLARRSGNHVRSVDEARRAVQIFQGLGDDVRVATARRALAENLQAAGRLKEAAHEIRAAIEQVEKNRDKAGSEEERLSYFQQRQDYYESSRGIFYDLYIETGDSFAAEQALSLNEKRLSRLLLETLPINRSSSGNPTLLAAEEQAYRDLLQAIDRPAKFAPKVERYRALRQSAEVRSKLYPALVKDQHLQSVAELRADLDAQTLILVYALGKREGYLWAIDDSIIRFQKLAASSQIELHADNYYNLLSNHRSGTANALTELLLQPVAELLWERPLVIVADGALRAIPFAALPIPQSVSAKQPEDLLVKRHEITQPPSLSVAIALRETLRSRVRPQHVLSSFAAPQFVRPTRSRDSGLGIMMEKASIDQLEALPYAREEALSISRFVPSHLRTIRLGRDASRSAFLSQDNSTRILHIATHTIIDDKTPELSGFVFSDTAGDLRQGFVQAFEIARLSLKVDLVILSSCEAAWGATIDGEGMLGLSRSFLQAGAGGVVASLWEIDDAATKPLIDQFTQSYLQGLSPSVALRSAQLEMIQIGMPPYLWASMIYQGDWLSN